MNWKELVFRMPFARFFVKNKYFNEHIVMTARKSLCFTVSIVE